MSKGSKRSKKSGYKPLATNDHHDDCQVTDPTAQPQNVKAAKVYVFGESGVAEEELYNGGLELTKLRPRGRAKTESRETEKTTPEETFIEVCVAEGNTLQSIALKYGCPVAELKRVNNLIKDQEFYALKILKVPVKRHGLLTEIVEKENQAAGANGPKLSLGAGASEDTVIHIANPCSSTDDNWDASDDGERTELLVRTVSIRGALSNQGKEAKDFLQKMDTDIKKIVSSTKTRKESLDDVTSTLTRKSIQPLHKGKKLFSDVDCGMSWCGAVIAIFVIGLLTPLLYFIYMEYGNQSSHNSSSSHGR